MKFVLVICIHVIVWYQISETKDLVHRSEHLRKLQPIQNEFEKAEAFSRILELYDQKQLRSISELWQSIKNTAINAWNHVKNIASQTKEKILAMIEDLKDKIQQIQSRFEERLNVLENEMKEIVEKAITTSQNIGKCLQVEKDEIDRIAREILRNVTSCISENIWQLTHLERKLAIDFNEKDFQGRLDDKLDSCLQKEDIDEECFHGVREELYSELEVMENDVLQKGLETRSVAEDLLNAIISCSTDGLIEASSNITMEVVKVIKCAAEETESETTTLPINEPMNNELHDTHFMYKSLN